MKRPGYTLVEILVATTLTLIMMAAVVQIFGLVGDSVSDSRATLEMNDRLRSAVRRLQMDLDGVTVQMLPPRSPANDEGYFENIEGPLGVVNPAHAYAVDANGTTDTTVADCDDVLMFTTRSPDKPFVGRLNGNTVESNVAEVVWFVRGGNLYRRVLLVLPGAAVSGNGTGFYAQNDISVRRVNGTVVANTLGDLTKRENRYAHYGNFPFDARYWGVLGLPTLGETSAGTWTVGVAPAVNVPTNTAINYWNWNYPQAAESVLGTGSRAYEDVILNHVIGFDLKVWDPRAPLYARNGTTVVGYGNYVDLGYGGSTSTLSTFSSYGQTVSTAGATLPMTYDTFSTHYEDDPATYGLPAGTVGRASNGFDDAGSGVVDSVNDRYFRPPYPAPLRGIQIKVRVFEPDSRQVREVTLVQDFLPK
jgi:hypothetical protein